MQAQWPSITLLLSCESGAAACCRYDTGTVVPSMIPAITASTSARTGGTKSLIAAGSSGSWFSIELTTE